jgi:hypothetical protein
MLDKAATIHPSSWWWVKTDGVDVVPGLGESMRMEWSGDVDLNDGALQQQYTSYMNQLKFIRGLGLRGGQPQLLNDLLVLHEKLGSDLRSASACNFFFMCVGHA